MRLCEVVGCEREAKREKLCVPCAFLWLVSSDSDRTPGREDRRRAFVARGSLRNQKRRGLEAA